MPYLDLTRETASLREELDAAIARVLDSGHYILSDEVDRFESAFATACGVSHAVGVASGTDAITIALLAAGVGPGRRGDHCAEHVRPDDRRDRAGGRHAGARRRRPGDLHTRPGGSRTPPDAADEGDPPGAPLRSAGRPGIAAEPRCGARRRRRRGLRPGARRDGRRQARWARSASRPRSASTRRRTSARSGTPEPSSPSRTRSPAAPGCSATTASGSASSTSCAGSTAGSTRSRRLFSRSSSVALARASIGAGGLRRSTTRRSPAPS